MPAGDIGVGGREIGFLFGQYKRLRNEFAGVLTGKGLNWGGSLIRPEATGYGCVYFAAEMLKTRKDTLEGKLCLVSGSGNVSQYTVEKLLDLGAKPLTVSDSNGVICDPDGINREKLAYIHGAEEQSPRSHSRIRGEVQEGDLHACRHQVGSQPAVEHQSGLRIPERDPERNQREGCRKPDQERRQGCRRRRKHAKHAGSHEAVPGSRILYGPAKAANAGGVATSGLEMAQNSARLSWTREEVDDRLHKIMIAIHKNCFETAEKYGTPGNLVNGANIGGFLKVANSMLDQGLV